MQAGAAAFRSATDQAPSFQRSGRTPSCCHRWPSALPSAGWKTKFVSGAITNASGSPMVLFRKKYWTCEPGVMSPSGRIFVNSLVVVTPFHPEPAPYAAQFVPSQRMLNELVAPPGAVMAQMNFVIPSVAYLGSLSWYMLAQSPGVRPTAEPLFAVGNRFLSTVSMRALFHVCWFQALPCAPLLNWPGLAMYSPKNVPSPGIASTPATSGRLRTPLALLPIVLKFPGPGRMRN